MKLKLKPALLAIILLSTILVSGCETTKGVAGGLGTTVLGTAQGVAKDTNILWQAALKIDNWIRENLW
jgi:hypothetical protein